MIVYVAYRMGHIMPIGVYRQLTNAKIRVSQLAGRGHKWVEETHGAVPNEVVLSARKGPFRIQRVELPDNQE